MTVSPINRFLLEHGLRIASNPCVSPDFCLDWDSLATALADGSGIHVYEKSVFRTAAG